MRKFVIAIAVVALLGGLLGASTVHATTAPTATLTAYQGVGQLTVLADPGSIYRAWDTAPDGTLVQVAVGCVGPTGMSQVMIPMTYSTPTLLVAVWDPSGGLPVFLTVEKDDRWIWD